MSVNRELAERAEVIAKRICRERGQPEAFMEMFFMEAYDEIMKEDAKKE